MQLQPLTLAEDGSIVLGNVNVSPSASNTSVASTSPSSASSNHNSSNNNEQLDSLTINGFTVCMDANVSSRYTEYIDELAQDLESRYWETKPPENWTSEDVWHWIFSWAGDRSVDVEEVQPLAYSNMTGSQLIQMSKNDFVNLNPKYGGHIYETLQALSIQFREFRSNSMSSSRSGSSATSSPLSSESNLAGVANNSQSVSSSSEFNQYFPALPSFDLLRASCLDLEGQGSSPGSGMSSHSKNARV